MAGQGVKRKLTKYFLADFEGYSKLISLNKEARLCTLGGDREIVGSKIARRSATTVTPRSAVPRGGRYPNPSGTRQ